MFFSKQIPLEQLGYLCRSLSTMLQAGIPIATAFDLVAESAANSRVRKIVGQIIAELRTGHDLTTATKTHSDALPELFLRMVSLGEQTGKLPEVLSSLADHYENNSRLIREFRSEITLPVVQFFAALLVIGCVIWFTGMIAEIRGPRGAKPGEISTDILGWGLQGTPGVIRWFECWLLLFVGLFFLYRVMKFSLPLMLAFHKTMLWVPVVGPCLRSFAIARFSWAFHLTQNAGVPMGESIDASLSATGNPLFISKSPGMIADLVRGQTITSAFRRSGLFDNQYLQMVSVGEVSGTVPESLHQLSPQFEDQANRRLKFLNNAAATAIWLLVAVFVIFLIFRMASWYAGLLDQGLDSLYEM